MIKKETDIFGLLFLRDGDTITRTLLLNIMELGAQDWKYSIFLRYGINVPEFTPHCNGCGAAFYICYALECKKRAASSQRITMGFVMGLKDG